MITDTEYFIVEFLNSYDNSWRCSMSDIHDWLAMEFNTEKEALDFVEGIKSEELEVTEEESEADQFRVVKINKKSEITKTVSR